VRTAGPPREGRRQCDRGVGTEGEGRKPFLDWVRDDYDEEALKRDFRANGLASFVNDWVLAHE
jgi:hypothetical protein